MKFILDQAKNFANRETKERLETLGFLFTENNTNPEKPFYLNHKVTPSIEIETLEQLMDFVKKWGDVVVSEGKITIYNDYLE